MRRSGRQSWRRRGRHYGRAHALVGRWLLVASLLAEWQRYCQQGGRVEWYETVRQEFSAGYETGFRQEQERRNT